MLLQQYYTCGSCQAYAMISHDLRGNTNIVMWYGWTCNNRREDIS